MKKTLFVYLIVWSINVSAQEMTCEEKANKFLIEKIKGFQSNDLIPYYSKKESKWGYFHRVTKRKITEPVMKDAFFFHPYINLYYSLETDGKENGCNGKILGSKENYRVENLESSGYQIFESSGSWDKEIKKSYKSMIKDDLSGFEVDAGGNLTYFNSKYYNNSKDEPNILDVITLKNKYYAIVANRSADNSSSTYSVIDQNGKPFSNFENLPKYPHRKQIYSSDEDVWFLMETGKDQYVFKSLLKGEYIEETFVSSSNWENDAQSIGYAIMDCEGKKSGVFDLVTMKWKIKPAVKNDFLYLNYSSLEPLLYNYNKGENSYNPAIEVPVDMINKNREITNIYIQTSKDTFYDLDLKLYKLGK